MLYLVELDHTRPGTAVGAEAGRAFIEQIIVPTLDRAEQLRAEQRIVAGGAVVGRVALRLIVEADSSESLDALIESLPVWPVAETRVTPLITFAERRQHVRDLAERLQRTGDDPTSSSASTESHDPST